jgi:polysaccharide chain length determinant protein (PEP-CTERM system associated)
MAQRVVAALLDAFVETSLGAQGDDADMTERALAMEIEDHEQRMEQAEAALADFKRDNLGFMPGDEGDYYSQLQAALSAVETTANEMRLLRQQRDELSRQLQGEEPVFGLMPPAANAGCSHAGTIAQLRSELSALLVDFTEKHPRIVMLRETIGTLEEQCRAEHASTPLAPTVMPGVDSLDANPVYQSLRLQLSTAEVQLVTLAEQHRTQQQQVAQLRDDVDKIAEVEKDLKRLNRDYGVVSDRHQQLLERWESLQSKKRIDPVTDQVQFDILEPPFAATKPVAPSRPVLLAAGLVVALGAGAALAFGLNQLRPVFFSRRTVKRMTGLPVLGSVSMIMLPAEIEARRRMTLLWAGASLGLIAAAIVVMGFADPISTIVRNLRGGSLV